MPHRAAYDTSYKTSDENRRRPWQSHRTCGGYIRKGSHSAHPCPRQQEACSEAGCKGCSRPCIPPFPYVFYYLHRTSPRKNIRYIIPREKRGCCRYVTSKDGRVQSIIGQKKKAVPSTAFPVIFCRQPYRAGHCILPPPHCCRPCVPLPRCRVYRFR